MEEAWIQLTCPSCDHEWSSTAAELPTPDAEYSCDACSATHSVAEFTHTARDLEILRTLGPESA